MPRVLRHAAPLSLVADPTCCVVRPLPCVQSGQRAVGHAAGAAQRQGARRTVLHRAQLGTDFRFNHCISMLDAALMSCCFELVPLDFPRRAHSPLISILFSWLFVLACVGSHLALRALRVRTHRCWPPNLRPRAANRAGAAAPAARPPALRTSRTRYPHSLLGSVSNSDCFPFKFGTLAGLLFQILTFDFSHSVLRPCVERILVFEKLVAYLPLLRLRLTPITKFVMMRCLLLLIARLSVRVCVWSGGAGAAHGGAGGAGVPLAPIRVRRVAFRWSCAFLLSHATFRLP